MFGRKRTIPRYDGEPFPRAAPDLASDAELQLPPQPHSVQGNGAQNVPIPYRDYAKSPVGQLAMLPLQSPAGWPENPQASGGRPIYPVRVEVGVQSVTPQPDGRRIARPMPSTARDETEVIR